MNTAATIRAVKTATISPELKFFQNGRLKPHSIRRANPSRKRKLPNLGIAFLQFYPVAPLPLLEKFIHIMFKK
jgi:hypothetical protein